MAQKYVKFMNSSGEYVRNSAGKIRVEPVQDKSIVHINKRFYVIDFHPDNIITARQEDGINDNPLTVEEAGEGEYVVDPAAIGDVLPYQPPDMLARATEEDEVEIDPKWSNVNAKGGKRKNRSNKILKLRKPVKWGGRKTRKQKRSTKKRKHVRKRRTAKRG